MSCDKPVRGWGHVGGATCHLPAGHKGYHSGYTFDCDQCGRTYRGEPYRVGGREGDELGFCFLCVKANERWSMNYVRSNE